MTVDCDVLVVGAGPAGSATAAALATAGRSVMLLEASRHPRPKACAEYASPMIAEELERLGLDAGAWQADAVPVEGMRVIRGHDAVDVRYADARGPRPAWGLERTRFDATLAAHAAARGVDLVERTAFVHAERASGAWRTTVRMAGGQERTLASRWLIGADGARSRVAHRLGVERPVRAPRRLGLIAHYEADPELSDHGEMHVGGDCYIGLAPLSDGRVNVGMALPANRAGSAERRFEAAIASLPAVERRLAGRRRLTPIRGASPIGHRVACAAGEGWLLVGDAAGFIDPFTGEGIYRALRSARAAADALATGDDGAAVRYLAGRRAAFTAKDALTWTIQCLLAVRPVMGYALRRLSTRDGLALRLGSALGDCRPASDALSPLFLAQVLRP